MKRVTTARILLFIAALGALEWVGMRELSGAVAAIGWLLMGVIVATFATDALGKWRPSQGVIRTGIVASIPAVAIWLVSGFVDVRVHPTASEEWWVEDSHIGHTVYRMRLGTLQFPQAPDWRVQWGLPLGGLPRWLLPFPTGRISLGNQFGGSSRGLDVCLWPLAAGTVVPTLVLARLRRKRMPAYLCGECGYDLTGNVSGRCPECGATVRSGSRCTFER